MTARSVNSAMLLRLFTCLVFVADLNFARSEDKQIRSCAKVSSSNFTHNETTNGIEFDRGLTSCLLDQNNALHMELSRLMYVSDVTIPLTFLQPDNKTSIVAVRDDGSGNRITMRCPFPPQNDGSHITVSCQNQTEDYDRNGILVNAIQVLTNETEPFEVQLPNQTNPIYLRRRGTEYTIDRARIKENDSGFHFNVTENIMIVSITVDIKNPTGQTVCSQCNSNASVFVNDKTFENPRISNITQDNNFRFTFPFEPNLKVNVSRVRVAFGAPKPNVERVVLTGWPLENLNTCHRPKEIDDGHWRYVNGSAYSEIEYTCNGSLVKKNAKCNHTSNTWDGVRRCNETTKNLKAENRKPKSFLSATPVPIVVPGSSSKPKRTTLEPKSSSSPTSETNTKETLSADFFTSAGDKSAILFLALITTNTTTTEMPTRNVSDKSALISVILTIVVVVAVVIIIAIVTILTVRKRRRASQAKNALKRDPEEPVYAKVNKSRPKRPVEPPCGESGDEKLLYDDVRIAATGTRQLMGNHADAVYCEIEFNDNANEVSRKPLPDTSGDTVYATILHRGST